MRLHFLVPESIDDPRRPSGGNVYDRRLTAELAASGWDVRERVVSAATLADVLASLPDGAVALVDGLVASTTGAIVAERDRLRVAVLLHMPEAGPFEAAVLSAVGAVVTVSEWARAWVVAEHGVPADRVHVAVPGVDPGAAVVGSAGGGNLLCVGPVTRDKGYDVLLEALAQVRDLDWHCRCVGALDIEPALVDRLYADARERGISDRVAFSGPLSREGVEALRSTSDLSVAPSRREAYGMAVAEGLARGIPVIATTVGGHHEAVGTAADGSVPGVMVRAGDAAALAAALRRWLTEPALRARLRRTAGARGRNLGTWAQTAAVVAGVLSDLNRTAPVAVSPDSRYRTDG